MEKLGFTVHHVYGLTEVYGPLTYCIWQPGHEELSLHDRAQFLSRQGVPHPTAEDATIMDISMTPMRADGVTIGELMLRGNTVMKGYLKNSKATEASFAGGWFHSGDLGVRHPDSYLEIKDRSKDIIISGGENISSIELEDVLYKHPAVQAASVVAKYDEKWGETPCAFIELKSGKTATAEEIIAYCRQHVAHYKVPRHVVFEELPKTSTGKVQKFVLRQMAKKV